MGTPKVPALIPLLIVAAMIGFAIVLLTGCSTTIDRAVDGVMSVRTRPGGCITEHRAGVRTERCDGKGDKP